MTPCILALIVADQRFRCTAMPATSLQQLWSAEAVLFKVLTCWTALTGEDKCCIAAYHSTHGCVVAGLTSRLCVCCVLVLSVLERSAYGTGYPCFATPELLRNDDSLSCACCSAIYMQFYTVSLD